MTMHEAFSPTATSARTDERKFRAIEGKFEDTYPNYYGGALVGFVLRAAGSMSKRQHVGRLSTPTEQQTSGPLNRLFRVLVGVLSAPKGDQGGWEGGARGL